MLGALSTIFWGVIVLSLLVGIHEFGHFIVARLCDVRVTEFFLGMPSRARISFKSKRHGTEFGITPILLGGYNRICGMESVDDDLLADVLAYIYRTGSVRIDDVAQAFSIDSDRAVAILSTLVDWASVRMDDTVDRDDPIFRTIPRDTAFRTEYDTGRDARAIAAHADGDVYEIPFDNAAFLASEKSRVYQGIGFGKRLAMLVMGPLVNILFAFITVVFALSVVGMKGGSLEPTIGSVYEGSLAEAAGIEPGDTVLSMGGHEISDWYGISDALDELLPTGEDFDIVVERAGERVVLSVDNPEDGSAEMLGITNTLVTVRLPLGDAVAAAFEYAGQVADFALRLINPAHTMEVVGQSSSIVGMSVMASEAASAGVFDLLLVVAAISMSLGFMNLLPLPPLDGGKILFELIQLVTGKPVSVKVQNIVSYVGLALLLALFLFVLKNDIVRYFM